MRPCDLGHSKGRKQMNMWTSIMIQADVIYATVSFWTVHG